MARSGRVVQIVLGVLVAALSLSTIFFALSFRQLKQVYDIDKALERCAVTVLDQLPDEKYTSSAEILQRFVNQKSRLASLNVEILDNTRFRGTLSSEPLLGEYLVFHRGACFATLSLDGTLLEMTGIVLPRSSSEKALVLHYRPSEG